LLTRSFYIPPHYKELDKRTESELQKNRTTNCHPFIIPI